MNDLIAVKRNSATKMDMDAALHEQYESNTYRSGDSSDEAKRLATSSLSNLAKINHYVICALVAEKWVFRVLVAGREKGDHGLWPPGTNRDFQEAIPPLDFGRRHA